MNWYDLVVIGGGAAGLVAVDLGLDLGLRVALVEKARPGGDCTWTGCVPSKSLLKVARVAQEMRTAGRYGLASAEPTVDLAAVWRYVRQAIAGVYRHETPEVLRERGVAVYLAAPRFLDARTLQVGPEQVRGRVFLLATGAHPFLPPIEGLESVPYRTYETIWDLPTLPRHLIIVGAGPIGCEMAQAFRRLGAEVTLVVSRGRVLPRDDPEAAQVIERVLEREGVRLLLRSRARRAWQDQSGIHLLAGEEEVLGDALLVATGRRPNVQGLGLEQAGVAYDEHGVRVNRYLRTSRRHIYAAGDVTGGPQFTHYAGWQAFQAVRNAFLPGAVPGVKAYVPWTTFTDPEVAHVGLIETQARERYGAGRVCRWPLERVDRAVAEGETEGLVKVVHAPDGTLLGMTIVAPRAGEMIQEGVLALEQKMRVSDLAGLMHVYPTYAVATMQAALTIRIERLFGGLLGRVLRRLAGWGRR